MIGKDDMNGAEKRTITCCRTFFALLAISMLSAFVPVAMLETGGWSCFRTAAVLHADETPQQSLLSSVPSGTDLVVAIDLERLLEVGFVREGLSEAREEADMEELQELLEKYGMELEDIGKELVLFADEDSDEGGLFGVVLRTAIEEAKFKEILEAESEEEEAFNYETIEVGGYGAYLLTEYRKGGLSGQADSAPGQMMPESAAVVYLAPDQMLLTGGAHIEGVIESIGGGRNLDGHPHPRMQDIDTGALVWGVYERADKDAVPAEDGENFWEGVIGLNFDVNLTGEDQQDFRFRLSTESASAGSASNMHQQTVMLSQLMLPMFFQDDPDMAQKLMEAIEIELSGREVNFSVSLERELIEALRKFTEAQQQQQQEDR